MLAATIRVDGAIEWDVRRIVVGDHRAAVIDDYLRGKRRQFGIQISPTIVQRLTAVLFKSARRIADSAASFMQ